MAEKFGDSRDELRKRCMTCWKDHGYCADAPWLMWGESCKHLDAIGPDIQRKLSKSRMARGE